MRTLIVKLDNACKLEKKTEALAYLAVFASARLESDILLHVKQAKELEDSREGIISSI